MFSDSQNVPRSWIARIATFFSCVPPGGGQARARRQVPRLPDDARRPAPGRHSPQELRCSTPLLSTSPHLLLPLSSPLLHLFPQASLWRAPPSGAPPAPPPPPPGPRRSEPRYPGPGVTGHAVQARPLLLGDATPTSSGMKSTCCFLK